MGLVRRTAAARRDYLDIFLYVAERDEAAADRLLHRFDNVLETISECRTWDEAVPNWEKISGAFPLAAIFYSTVRPTAASS